MLALDSDVCPTSVPSPVAPLNTYTFLKTWEKRSHGEQIWEHFWTRSHAWEGGLP
jgi:hypothetical protein